MTRTYTKRETATQNPDDPELKDGDTMDSGSPALDDSTGDGATAEKAVEKPKKAKTRAQHAREDAEKVRAEQDAATLASSPTFQVSYPAGISLHAPGKDEVEVTMSGGEKVWIDVVGEHVHVPNDARVRASSTAELTTFIRMAGAGLLKQVAP